MDNKTIKLIQLNIIKNILKMDIVEEFFISYYL